MNKMWRYDTFQGFHEYHEFHETCRLIVLVNSHQRWKQVRNRVCFHLWCELTLALRCHSIVCSLSSWNKITEWQVSWNSCISFCCSCAEGIIPAPGFEEGYTCNSVSLQRRLIFRICCTDYDLCNRKFDLPENATTTAAYENTAAYERQQYGEYEGG